MTKQLTAAQKVLYLPIIIPRDGNICFYCVMPFIPEVPKWDRVFDHLNCDPTDNRVENLVLAHEECNQNKKFNLDWQILAERKLEKNVNSAYLGARGGEKKEIIQIDTNMEIDTNIEFSRITKEYLNERLLPNGGRPPAEICLDYKESLNTITHRCHKLTGHASQNTIRRIIDMFCCIEGKFEKIKTDGKVVIRRRRGK